MRKIFQRCIVFLSVLTMVLLTSCSTDSANNNQLPAKQPSDFNFVLDYGVNAQNQIDTQKGTYTKDMIIDPSVTTKLKLSDEEMKEIYTTMRKIKIFSYPDNYKPNSNMHMTPYYTYSIKIIADGKEKNIYWEDENASKRSRAVKLRSLFTRIHEIIVAKEEYKKLPQAKGGYD